MKKTFTSLFLTLISFILLSAQNNVKIIWTINAVAETTSTKSDNINWFSRDYLNTNAVLRNDTFEIKDFSTFFITDLKKEVQGFARRDIYTFNDEYGQTGKIVFQTDPTNMDDDCRYLIFIQFENTEKGRVFFANKPQIIQAEYNQTYNRNDEIEEETVPFVMVEEKPQFMGSDCNKFSYWITQHLVYPQDAKTQGIEGIVTTEFTVNSDGNVQNIKILRGVHPSLDAEAIRVISMSPQWKPGKHKGKTVPVSYTFPIIFKLR